MKLAALDLGSNSFLCLIAEVDSSEKFHVLHDEVKVVRLGQELGKTGSLHSEALKRADQCLKHFSEVIKSFQVDHVEAVATAAAREAENAEEFIQICENYKIPLTTISGEEEALMSFRGAIRPDEKEKVLLIDIGGGSTEHTVGTLKKIELAQSIPYGAVKLTEKYIQNQPVPTEQEKELREFIRKRSEELWAQVEALQPQKIWAVAGTPTALAAAILGKFDRDQIEGMVLNRQLLIDWLNKFRNSSIEEKKQKYGLGDRSDVIFAGVVILDELLGRLNLKEIHISTRGIRYGLAYQMVSRYNN